MNTDGLPVQCPGVPEGWMTLGQAERDAAYNNTAAVANVADLHAARAKASEIARAAPGARLDRRYGPAPRAVIDLFPASNPSAPCLVFIHGGYWQMNSKDSFACLGDGLRAHGWSAALPGYTLAPDTSLRGIVAEIHAALNFLAIEGPREGIAGPLIVAGWSAGGHLAALALRHPAVVAGLSISGIHELAPLRDTYLNKQLKLTDEEIDELSPLRLPIIKKPFLIAYGTDELPALRLNAVAFHAARRETGAPGFLIAVPGLNHFTILETLQDQYGVLTNALLDLLR